MTNWIPCTGENYWNEDPGILTIVRVKFLTETFTFTQDNCPYGWDVLVDAGAYMIDVSLKNFD